MSRLFCIPGIVFLFCALVLSFLASISLPYLPALDVTRVHFQDSNAVSSNGVMTELRFGVWAACYYTPSGDRTCLKTGHAYQVEVKPEGKDNAVTIGSSWTRGLAVQPVATAVTLIALAFSFGTSLFLTLVASIFAFLAAVLHLISFAIAIALFAYVKDKMGDLNVGAKTITGPGFWLIFVSLILCLLAGCTVCFGRRRDKGRTAAASALGTSTEKPSGGFLSRFKKN